MPENTTALALFNSESEGGSLVFCSVQAGTMAERAKLFNTINNPEHKLGDVINQVIWLRDVYSDFVPITRTDSNGAPMLDETGAPIVDDVQRYVLIDKDGDAYQCMAASVGGQLRRLFKFFGAPTWENPIPVEVKQQSTGVYRIYVFNIRHDLM